VRCTFYFDAFALIGLRQITNNSEIFYISTYSTYSTYSIY
jgi:hypothetical protein